MKRLYKILTISGLSLSLIAAAHAQSGTLRLSTYSTDPAKSPGFSTSEYEAWEYRRTTSTGAQQNLPFRMLKPVGYSGSTSHPLIIMLHGRGEAGTDNNYHLIWGGKEHLAAVKNKTFDGFVVFPQEPYGAWTNGPAYQANGSQPSEALTQVWDLVDSLGKRFNIDKDRIYIHGLSSGGTGVWASMYYKPDLFTAAQIMSAPGDVTQAYKIASIPLWLHQGGTDTNPAPSVSRNVMSSLRNAGAVNPATTKYTEYPNVAHTTWINAYNDTDFFPFFLRQNKRKIKVLGINPYPAGSSVSLGINGGMGAYQWYKDGAAVSGASSYRLDNISQPGTYTVMFKRKSSDVSWVTSEPLAVGVNNAPNIMPQISFTNPMNNSSYTAPASIPLRTSASDRDGLVSKIEFFSGSTLLYSTSYEPYNFTWSNVPVGNYQITARVTDNVGGVATSTVNINVNNLSNQLPTVSFTSPANGSSLNAPSNVTISVEASDVDGKIAKVDIYNGSTLMATKQWAPYNHYLYNVPAGNYTFVAVATDDKGATKTSSPVNITIGNNTNPAPEVSITSPVNYASFASPATINISASASDADGISKVEFYNGTTLLGTSTGAPYQYTWTGVAAGNYTIIAKATDGKGVSKSSSSVNINVSGASNNQVPFTSITSPANNSSLPPNTTYTITANASDNDGSITKVEFFRGTTLLGTDTYPPYTYTVYGQSAGTFAFTTKATDNQGGVTTSAPVSVTFGGIEYFNLSASCLTAGQTYSIELKSEYTANATKFAYWYTGTGLNITPVAGQPHKAGMTATNTVTSGEVCVGVNYTTSPSYRQFCKAINKCAQNREDNSLSDLTSLVIDPATNTYLVNAARNVASVNVVDMNGQVVYTSKSMVQGEILNFNSYLPGGMYIVNVLYSDGGKEAKHMPKVR